MLEIVRYCRTLKFYYILTEYLQSFHLKAPNQVTLYSMNMFQFTVYKSRALKDYTPSIDDSTTDLEA